MNYKNKKQILKKSKTLGNPDDEYFEENKESDNDSKVHQSNNINSHYFANILNVNKNNNGLNNNQNKNKCNNCDCDLKYNKKLKK